MKKCILLGLVIILFFTSCQKSQIVILTGEIQNYDNTPLLIGDYKITPVPDTIFVKDGKFFKSLHIDYPCFKNLDFGKFHKEIFLIPGQSLIISFDVSNFESSFKFDGDLATENAILDSLNQRFNNFNFWTINSLSVQKATNDIDSVFEAETKYFENLKRSKDVNPVFSDYIKASVEYYYADLKTMVARQNHVKDYAFYSYLNKIAIENNQYLDIPDYRSFLVNYFFLLVDREFNQLDSVRKKLPDAYNKEAFKVNEKFNDIKVREYLLFDMISRLLKFNDAKVFDKYAEYYNEHNTDSAYAKRIRKMYARKLLLAKGMPAPEFICTDIDSNTISLKNFSGKYVYIDFWATWCEPCRQELPGYIKLQSNYKGKNIAFVSISLDVDRKIWEKVIAENKSEGINLISNKGWNSDVVKDYQITGIPAYVLIDKEGRIIDRYAHYPSSGGIKKTLDELLKAN